MTTGYTVVWRRNCRGSKNTLMFKKWTISLHQHSIIALLVNWSNRNSVVFTPYYVKINLKQFYLLSRSSLKFCCYDSIACCISVLYIGTNENLSLEVGNFKITGLKLDIIKYFFYISNYDYTTETTNKSIRKKDKSTYLLIYWW